MRNRVLIKLKKREGTLEEDALENGVDTIMALYLLTFFIACCYIFLESFWNNKC